MDVDMGGPWGALPISWWGPWGGLYQLVGGVLGLKGWKGWGKSYWCVMVPKILNCMYHKFFLGTGPLVVQWFLKTFQKSSTVSITSFFQGRSPSLFNVFQKNFSKKPQLYLVNDYYINIKPIYIKGFFWKHEVMYVVTVSGKWDMQSWQIY